MPRLGSTSVQLSMLVLACCLAWAEPVPADRPPRRSLATLRTSVAEVDDLVQRAYFRKAASLAESTREWAGEVPRSPDAKQARARLEVLLSTAQVALGRRDEALRSMGRALYMWPLLRLDESDTSPRVVELFHEVRGGGTRKGSKGTPR